MFEFSPPALPSVDFPLDFSESLNSVAGFITQLQSAIASAIQHPFLAILFLLVGIGLLQLIADLVKRILKASIAFVLTLPLNLSQWIWKRATASSTTSKETQIEQLIDRLETLRTEEAQIISELKGLLSSTKTNSSTLLTSPTEQDSLETAKPTTNQTAKQTTGKVAETITENNTQPES